MGVTGRGEERGGWRSLTFWIWGDILSFVYFYRLSDTFWDNIMYLFLECPWEQFWFLTNVFLIKSFFFHFLKFCWFLFAVLNDSKMFFTNKIFFKTHWNIYPIGLKAWVSKPYGCRVFSRKKWVFKFSLFIF